MPRRGDNIHKRKDGRWEGRYKAGNNAAGKTVYKSVYAKTYSDCKSLLELARDTHSFLPKSNAVKNFRDILLLWLDANRIRLKNSTVNKYEHLIYNHIIPVLGSYRIDRISSYNINLFLDSKLQNGSLNGQYCLSPAYVRSIATIIQSAMKFAANEGFCIPLRSPINKPSINSNKIRVLTREEQSKMELVLKQESSSVALGTLIALNTGLRIGEICALNWDDVDMNRNLIYVNHTVTREIACDYSTTNARDFAHKSHLTLGTPKTRSSRRVVPISSVLKSVLELYYKPHSYVISGTESFVDTRTFEYQFRRLVSQIGIPKNTFHALRHTFATRCLQGGMEVKTLSEILGHASATITLNTYVHSSLEEKRSQIEMVFVRN